MMGGTSDPSSTAPPGFEDALSIDAVVERMEQLDPARRQEAILAEDVLAFAVVLSEEDLARLKCRFEGLKLRLAGFSKVVQQRRREREAVARRERRQSTRPSPAVRTDERSEIVINELEEHEVNEAAVAALARVDNVYERMGSLVRVVDARHRRPGEMKSYLTTEIRSITEPLLRELFARAARWREARVDKETGERVLISAHPPDWAVRAVHAWGSWPSLAALHAVADAPVLLGDASLLQARAYDPLTGILCRTRFTVELPEQLTRTDAYEAARRLLDLVSQVPFENDASRSAWVCALLTVVGRSAFSGQAPLFLFDANVEGIGKGLLVKIIGWILLGRECDVVVQTADEEEERKRITSRILSGQPVVLIDEVTKPFGSPALQALLTTGVWGERVTGTAESPSLITSTIWFAAGNNVQFRSGDIRRRTCVIRLVTDEVHPEERRNFKIADMEAYVQEHRAELFCAALIMLRAWMRSGLRPEQLDGWRPWGSVNGWDRVVRAAVVYAGLTDPIAAKAASKEPTAKEGVGELVAGLAEIAATLGGPSGEVTTKLIHDALVENDEQRALPRAQWEKPPATTFRLLRSAFAALIPHLAPARAPTSAQIGTLLGQYKEKPVVVQGTKLRIAVRLLEGVNLWRVEHVAALGAHVASAAARTTP
jgi:hypothetical protein